jgi:hypothetical protein
MFAFAASLSSHPTAHVTLDLHGNNFDYSVDVFRFFFGFTERYCPEKRLSESSFSENDI